MRWRKRMLPADGTAILREIQSFDPVLVGLMLDARHRAMRIKPRPRGGIPAGLLKQAGA